MYILGIDAGAQSKNTGLALYSPNHAQFVDICSMNAYEAMEKIKHYKARAAVNHPHLDMSFGVIIEDPTINRTTWRGGRNQATTKKIAVDNGRCQGVAIVFVQMFEYYNIPYITVAPSARRRMPKGCKSMVNIRNRTKVSHDIFVEHTKWTKQTNDHSRDAGTLPWKLTTKDFLSAYNVQKQIRDARKQAKKLKRKSIKSKSK